MLRWSLITVCVALLMACATPAERAAYTQAQREQIIHKYGPGCEQAGSPDTEPWKRCVVREARRNGDLHNLHRPPMLVCTGPPAFGCALL